MGAIGIGLDKDSLINGLWENYEIKRVIPNKEKDENIKMYRHYTKIHNLLEKFYLELSKA